MFVSMCSFVVCTYRVIQSLFDERSCITHWLQSVRADNPRINPTHAPPSAVKQTSPPPTLYVLAILDAPKFSKSK